MKIFIKFLVLIFVFFNFVAKAQDPVYSQFYNNLLNVNPAFAGIHGDYRIVANGQQ